MVSSLQFNLSIFCWSDTRDDEDDDDDDDDDYISMLFCESL